MRKSAAQLKKEQRENNVALGRTVRFDRQLTPDERDALAKTLNALRALKDGAQ